MSEEPVKFLKLSENPQHTAFSVDQAPDVIEEFLSQLSEADQLNILGRLLDGQSMVSQHGETEGREKAAHRLSQLMGKIGEAAHDLCEVEVEYDEGYGVIRTDTLTALTSAAVVNV